MALAGMFLLAPPAAVGHRPAGRGRQLPGRPQPAAAHVGVHRAGEGAVPQQRDQPRRTDPAGHRAGERDRQVGAVPAGGQPGRRARAADGLHASSARAWPRATAPGAAIIQFFGGIHEVYFPYVLMKPRPDPGHDRRRHDADLHQRDLRLRTASPGRTGVDLRRLRADSSGQLPRRHAVGDRWRRRSHSSSPALLLKTDKGDWDEADLQVATESMVAMKGKESHRIVAWSQGPMAPAHSGPIQQHRVRLRRGDGLLGDGRLGAAQEDQGRRATRDVTVVNRAISNLDDT